MTATEPDVDTGLLGFPPGFVWGAATASFQIEGSTTVDGRGASIWDTFAATPGRVRGGHTGEPACDHYRRYAGDVALMSGLGLGAYRFSVAWPRIQPTGVGRVESRGLAFYDRLVDELLAHEIEPVATLYHWDLPQALEDVGGWRNRDTAYRFADYAAVVHARLGDRVRQWTTVNEPWCSAFLGYGSGVHAPGVVDPKGALEAAHHLLLGHGLALRAMSAAAPAGHLFSIVLNFSAMWVDVDDEPHRLAARGVDGLQHRIFLDPLAGRGYPADVLAGTAWLGDWQRVVRDGDLAVVATPVDWLGVNYYSPTRVAPAPPDHVAAGPFAGLRGVELLPPRGELTGFGWEADARAFTELLERLGRDVAVPLVITENGSAFPDVVAGGRVDDGERTRYLVDHLRAVHTAIERGVDVRGYFAWSLLDNFEWAAGYGQRFGVVHVDFATQERTVKRSGHTLADVIRHNAVPAAGYRLD
ncbi:GH1 family beta-glucosidase [Actinosynnema sp. NPDC047251]|uniref:Beta-glucosidase n=1 Tax=Saccharothrix espanaensis (strain ATCC 51144 / DSM 44229 / JCM 9112 / NBRC 15066 / NRRL 15764) TaxID=1179773 RepID=K0KB51_SACES|nr:GH1 family beta-glucosidase [Saccharothrix espanaensis]CCH34039.1 Beta-glucosidase A [Saccharothrix espanaensis DSM 44229]